MFQKNEFNAMLAQKGISKSDLALHLGIKREALYRRINAGEFNANEIEIMFKLFGVKQTIKALFGKNVVEE